MSFIHDIFWSCMNVVEMVKRTGITTMIDFVMTSPITQKEIDFLNTELTKLCQNSNMELDFLYISPLLSLRFLVKSSEQNIISSI